MEQLTYKLDIYEGPLDLLLDLIAKNKLDITDIPIALICDQYMAYIAQARAMDMELAGEFIVMASELLYIKSKVLLPHTDPGEEDPRASLSEMLLLYKQAKDAAQHLAPMYSAYGGRLEKEEEEIRGSNELPNDLSPELLRRAVLAVSVRLAELEAAQTRNLSPLVREAVVPVSEKIEEIVHKLKKKPATLRSFLCRAQTRSSLIAVFMALLELIKEHTIVLLDGDTDAGNIGDGVLLRLDDAADLRIPASEF